MLYGFNFMRDLTNILESIEDTERAIIRTEQVLVDHPDTPSLVSTLRSLNKRKQDLEESFYKATHKNFLDVCTYRLFSEEEDERPNLKSLSSTLLDFQNLFTVVYDAIKNGPKKTSHINPESELISSFGFAYSFTGSVGVVLTMPNERLLFGETHLDDSINLLFSMANAGSSEEIKDFARVVGVAPIWKMYKWALDQTVYGLGSEIEWRRERTVRAKLLIQRPQLEALTNAIFSTSENVEEIIELTGNLIGADIKAHTFHLVHAGGDIKGKMDKNIGIEATVELPKRYKATIEVNTKTYYAVEKEEKTYYLVSLTPID